MPNRLSQIALMVLIIASPAPAHAQIIIGVLPLSLEGELSETSSQVFESSLVSALQSEGVTVTGSNTIIEATGMERSALRSCTDAICLGRIVENTGIDAAIRVEVHGSLNMYSLEIEAFSQYGRQLAALEGSCDLCSRAEVLESLQSLGRQAMEGLPRTGTVRLAIAPTHATLSVDGTPTEGREISLPPGPHLIQVAAESHHPEEREITVRLGEETAVEISLEEVSPAGSDPELPPQQGLDSLGISGIVLTAVGGLTLVGGIILTAFDGTCAGGRTDSSGQCELIYSTLSGGVAMIATGASALIAGIVMLVVSRVRRRQRETVESRRFRLSSAF